MAAEMTASTAAELRSSSLGRASVRALIASWLGWMFDGYETYALVLVMGSAVHQFLPQRSPATRNLGKQTTNDNLILQSSRSLAPFLLRTGAHTCPADVPGDTAKPTFQADRQSAEKSSSRPANLTHRRYTIVVSIHDSPDFPSAAHRGLIR
jgi:hypothetical protein